MQADGVEQWEGEAAENPDSEFNSAERRQ
jgi:hypothetical protein